MLQWKHHKQPQLTVRKLTWSPARGADSSVALKTKHISLKTCTGTTGNLYLGSLIQLTYLPCLINALARSLSVYLTSHQVTKYTEDALQRWQNQRQIKRKSWQVKVQPSWGMTCTIRKSNHPGPFRPERWGQAQTAGFLQLKLHHTVWGLSHHRPVPNHWHYFRQSYG